MKRQWYSTTAGIPGLASSEQARRVTDWRRERRWEDGGAEPLSATGDGGQTAVSVMPDVDGTGSGSLLGSTLSTLLKK